MDAFIQPHTLIIGALPARVCTSELPVARWMPAAPAGALSYSLTVTGVSSGCATLTGFSSGASFSQSHPSLIHA